MTAFIDTFEATFRLHVDDINYYHYFAAKCSQSVAQMLLLIRSLNEHCIPVYEVYRWLRARPQ